MKGSLQLAAFAALLILLAPVAASCGKAEPGSLELTTLQFGVARRTDVSLSTASGREVASAQSDTLGRVRFEELRPGEYLLNFREPGGRRFAAVRTVTIGEGQQVRLEIEVTEKQPGAAPSGEETEADPQ